MTGGQSIPMLDYYLAPFVAKSFVRNCATFLEANAPIELHWGLRDEDFDPALIKKKFTKVLDRYIDENTHVMNDAGEQAIEAALAELFAEHGVSEHVPEFSVIAESIPCIMDRMLPFAKRRTERDTFQAMEATVHNLCTLSSRAGGQVPFSSVNLGTDISEEGRMVTRNLFLATEAGLGSGETAVFPISVMKMKKGVTDKGSPNYDLFQLACRVSSKRLFPNFTSIDSTFNLQHYVPGKPETENATMGCRTRVLGNTFDPDNAVAPGRGNLFPITTNLPYLALEVKEALKEGEDLYTKFNEALDKRVDDILQMLADRFEVVAKKKAKNFPFAMGQHLYIGSENLGPNDEIREVIKHGTLVVGFIGLAETLVALTGKHHGESEESWKMGLEIIGRMNDRVAARAKETTMNYSFMASPAEGCCGRLLQCTRKRFGVIPGITDRAYLSNSFHVPVYYKISAYDKIRIEAPFHALCPAG